MGIRCFNVESAAELERLNQVGQELGRPAPISIRINPDVDPQTHPYISTGLKENKFGIDFEDIEPLYAKAAKELEHIELRGIQMHIGSQLTRIGPFVEAAKKVAQPTDLIFVRGSTFTVAEFL